MLNSLSRIPALLEKLSAKKIFLVIDRDAYKYSGAEETLKDCFSKYETVVFDEFELNPKLEDVLTGVESLKKTPCDITIVIGGGSAIDVAKLITSFTFQTESPEEIIKGTAKISIKGIPVIAIPTTAGTGSEATHFAVVYMDKVKYSVASEYLLPDYPVVDSTLTMSLPSSVTMASGLDALCQGVESFWSVNSTDESLSYSREAIQLAWTNLKQAVLNPTMVHREAMCRASHLAGQAINISKTTAPHAFSYAITTYYGVPHGAAVALTLSEFLKYNSGVTKDDCQDSRGYQFVQNQFVELLEFTGCSSSEDFVNQFKLLLKSIQAPVSLNDVGVTTEKQLNYLVGHVNPERMANNPRKILSGSLRALLRASIL